MRADDRALSSPFAPVRRMYIDEAMCLGIDPATAPAVAAWELKDHKTIAVFDR